MLTSSEHITDPKDHPRLEILGVRISDVTIPKAAAIIDGWVRARHKTYVCVAPVSTLVDCQKNVQYKNVVNAAGMVTPDGMPVVWLGRSKGSRTIERTYGPDLLSAVCGEGKFRHFFYGGAADTLDRLEQRLKGKNPDINIVGKLSPEFVPQVRMENAEIIDRINRARPDILWVGLGSPKQDLWMSMHRPLLDVPVIIGVGAAFDFLSGVKPQAPRWMQKSGLEWIFRLVSEPRRLWKRYLIGNTMFIFYVCREQFRSFFKIQDKAC